MGWKFKVYRLINRGLEPVGLALRRFHSDVNVCVMESPRVRARQINIFRNAMAKSLASFPSIAQSLPSEERIRTFAEELLRCPIVQDTGGGGFSDGILLWTIASALDAEFIVESGVFRGFTTWVFRQACPQAQQYAFDISFSDRKRIESGVIYHENHWAKIPLKCPERGSAFIYFDDHVDQWKRIREAAARGFRYLIFDDSLPSTALHNDGASAAPTVDMLFETDILEGEQICWRTECGPFFYRHDERLAAETRSLVKRFTRLPDLRFVFGYAPSNLVLVEIDQNASG